MASLNISEIRMSQLGLAVFWISFLIVNQQLQPCQGARILLVPISSTSHVSAFSHVAEPLIAKGHQVFAVVNGACSKGNKMLDSVGVQSIPFYTPNKQCIVENTRPGVEDLISEMLWEVEFMLKDHSYFQVLQALNIDLCIVDGLGVTLYTYILPYKLGVDHVTLTTSFFGTWANVPALPSFTPYLYEPLTDEMNFVERVRNTINLIRFPMELQYGIASRDELIKKYVPEKTPITFRALQRRSKLWLIETDPILDYPRALLPHIIHVGGLTAKDRKPLSAEFNQILKQTKSAVIVSFGSILNSLPDDSTKKFIEAFRRVKDVTFLMKYKGNKIDNVPENVHLTSWFPQNDLLGHPSVRLFITHCGNNGQFEALYHAVPMLGFPMFGDQFYGAKRMEVKGFGIAMDMNNFTIDDLVNNINKMLNDESYEIAIDAASQAYHDQVQNPRERAAYWIDHIIKFGADHLISAAVEMPWYQFWMMDILALFLSVMFIVVVVVSIIVYGIVRMISSPSKTKKD